MTSVARSLFPEEKRQLLVHGLNLRWVHVDRATINRKDVTRLLPLVVSLRSFEIRCSRRTCNGGSCLWRCRRRCRSCLSKRDVFLIRT